MRTLIFSHFHWAQPQVIYSAPVIVPFKPLAGIVKVNSVVRENLFNMRDFIQYLLFLIYYSAQFYLFWKSMTFADPIGKG